MSMANSSHCAGNWSAAGNSARWWRFTRPNVLHPSSSASDAYAVGESTRSASSALQRALSADGRFVAFVSSSPDLVPGDTNGVDDVFVHDTRTGVTTRVSVATDGSQASHFSGGPFPGSFEPAISADGR
jgi:hypothetical protein